MAIAYDASSESGANFNTAVTWNHTVTGADPILFVFQLSGSGDYGNGGTYAGAALTLVSKAQVPGTNEWGYLYYLVAPATGTNAIVISASQNSILAGVASSYTGAKQTNQPDSLSTGTAGPFAASLTLTTSVSADDCWIVGGWRATNGSLSAGAGTTLRKNPATQIAIGDSNATVSPGSRSLIATQASSAYAGVIASFTIPAVGGGGGGTPARNLTLLGVG
jgi:hypothetical protein